LSLISSILLLACLANICLLVYVLKRRHTRSVHFSFAFLLAVIAAWIFCNFLISLTDSPAQLGLVGRLAFGLGAAIGAGYVAFSWRFPETGHPSPPRWFRRLSLAVSAVVILVSLSPLVQEGVMMEGGRKLPVAGPLYGVFVGYMFLAFCLGTWGLCVSLRQTHSVRERMQVVYTLVGFVSSFVFSYFAVFTSPFLSNDSDFYLLGAVSPLIWTFTTTYAICRYRLMDIGVALRNVLVHAVSTCLVAAGILGPLLLIAMFDSVGVVPLAFVVASAVFLYALVMPIMQKRLVHFVDHRIFRGRYDHETALVHFGSKLLLTQGRDRIAAMAAREIAVISAARSAAFYLLDAGSKSYRLCAAWGEESERRFSGDIPAGHPLLQGLGDPPVSLLREEATYGPSARWEGGTPEVEELIDELGLELLVPLVCRDRFLGFLVLGEKQRDNTFGQDDIQLVESLSSQVAFALDNAQLYEQVLASNRKYEMILRHIQRAVLAVDEKLVVTAINPTGAELFGVSPQECIGMDVGVLSPDLKDLLQRTIRQGSNLPPVERAVLGPGGRSLPVECETSVIHDAQDAVVGALLVFHDLTERKSIEEEMRRIDRLASVGTLAAGVAHEIKNPLVAIQTFAQLLPERYEDESFRSGFGSVVHAEISRINSLVQDLLEFARPVQGEVGPVNLHELVDRAEALLGNDLKGNNVHLAKQFESPEAIVRGNPEQLYQVVLNVLQNAVECMPEDGGSITVGTRAVVVNNGVDPAWQAIEMTFADTGGGIDKEDLPRIFDPFFSRKEQGSGLGLAVCHGILKNHGAEISVQSKVGRGTTFVFTIPVDSERQPQNR
jgi:PAS domain S-box-containing protein